MPVFFLLSLLFTSISSQYLYVIKIKTSFQVGDADEFYTLQLYGNNAWSECQNITNVFYVSNTWYNFSFETSVYVGDTPIIRISNYGSGNRVWFSDFIVNGTVYEKDGFTEFGLVNYGNQLILNKLFSWFVKTDKIKKYINVNLYLLIMIHYMIQ